MAKHRLTDKSQRLLTFLMALRFKDVRKAMKKIGYGKAQRREGWGLLMASAGDQLDAATVPSSAMDGGKLRALDEWENTWYPVVEATLRFNFPEVHAAVFAGIAQTSGAELTVTLTKFFARIKELAEAPLALLDARGFTKKELARGEALLRAIVEVPDDEDEVELDGVPTLEALDDGSGLASLTPEEAEAKLWAHYQEWSTIARVRIESAQHLRLMGFSGDYRRSAKRAPSEIGEIGEVGEVGDTGEGEAGATSETTPGEGTGEPTA